MKVKNEGRYQVLPPMPAEAWAEVLRTAALLAKPRRSMSVGADVETNDDNPPMSDQQERSS